MVLHRAAVKKKRLKTADTTIPLLVCKDSIYDYTVKDGVYTE
jgi:hypothetical protein